MQAQTLIGLLGFGFVVLAAIVGHAIRDDSRFERHGERIAALEAKKCDCGKES